MIKISSPYISKNALQTNLHLKTDQEKIKHFFKRFPFLFVFRSHTKTLIHDLFINMIRRNSPRCLN